MHDSFNTIKQLKKRDDFTLSNGAETGISTEDATALRERIFGGTFGQASGNKSKVRNLAGDRLAKLFTGKLGIGRGGVPNKPKLNYSLQGNTVDEFKWAGSISDMAMRGTIGNFDEVENNLSS